MNAAKGTDAYDEQVVYKLSDQKAELSCRIQIYCLVYYVPFRTNIQRKGITPSLLPRNGT